MRIERERDGALSRFVLAKAVSTSLGAAQRAFGAFFRTFLAPLVEKSAEGGSESGTTRRYSVVYGPS